MKLTPELLAGLTREEKLRLLDLAAEKRRRAREKRDTYSPNPGQEPVHRSGALLRAVFSGNGGGKTALGVNEALWAMRGFNPLMGTHTAVPCRVIVVLDKPEKVETTWLPELRKWANIRPDQLRKNGKPYISQIVDDNGSTLTFMFHEMEPLSFESIEADFFIFDEPPPRHVYIGLRRAGRTKGRKARYLIIGTPLAAPWLRTEVYEPWARGEAPDTDCFRFGTDVNRANLADGYIEQFSSVLSEKERRIRLFGEFFDLEGLALAHLFDRTTHVLPSTYEFDAEKYPVVVAIDPHPSKKHVALMVGADEYGLIALKELSLKAIPRQFAKELKRWMAGYRVLDIVCDNLGSSEMTGGEGFKSFIQICQEEGVRARATTYQEKDDEEWIARIQDVLAPPEEPNNFGQRIPKLRVMPQCSGLISDIETVQWVKYRNLDEFKPKLDIGSKDYLACAKYALACNLTHQKKKATAYYYNRPAYGISVAPTPGISRVKIGRYRR